MKSEQVLYFHVMKNLLSTYYMPAALIGGRDARKGACGPTGQVGHRHENT